MIDLNKRKEIYKEITPFIKPEEAELLEFINRMNTEYAKKEPYNLITSLESLRNIGYVKVEDTGDVELTYVGMSRAASIAKAKIAAEEQQKEDEVKEDEERERVYQRLIKCAEAIRNAYPKGKKDNTWAWKDSLDVTKLRLLSLEKKLGRQFTVEEVTEAANAYVKSFGNDTKYMVLAKYFIWKNDDVRGFQSPLLDTIEKLKNGEDMTRTSQTFDYTNIL